MSPTGSDLTVFMLDGLSRDKYRNLFYADDLKETVCLYCPRKDSANCTSAYMQIFKDWDGRKKHQFKYSESKQRLLSALKRSVYLMPVSDKHSKDTYVFRFASLEEIAVNKEKQKKKDNPHDRYTSDGESNPSSPESLCSLPSPGHVDSPGDFSSGLEAAILELPMAVFSDELQNLPKVMEDLAPDLEALIPSLTPKFSGSMKDLCNVYLGDSGTLTLPEQSDSLLSPMDYEPSDFLHASGTAVERQNSPQSIEDLAEGAYLHGTMQNQSTLDLQTIQAVLQLVPSNFSGIEDGSSEPVFFLVNNSYLVTLKRLPTLS